MHNPGERHRLGSAELVSIMGRVAKGSGVPLIKATEGLLVVSEQSHPAIETSIDGVADSSTAATGLRAMRLETIY